MHKRSSCLYRSIGRYGPGLSALLLGSGHQQRGIVYWGYPALALALPLTLPLTLTLTLINTLTPILTIVNKI